jgi:putative transposase
MRRPNWASLRHVDTKYFLYCPHEFINWHCLVFNILMAEKFRNRYRVSSSRLPGYDYTRNGSYFVTICTRNKIPYFGVISKGKMILSETGIIAQGFWLEIQNHFPEVFLDEFIIMPDHIHGIIEIKSKSKNDDSTLNADMSGLGILDKKKTMNQFRKPKLLGSIINQFKRICTIKTKTTGLDLIWQPRYYDHIIRSETELQIIRHYIKNNPSNWSKTQHH